MKIAAVVFALFPLRRLSPAASVRCPRSGDDGSRQRSAARAGRASCRLSAAPDRLRGEQGDEQRVDARSRRRGAEPVRLSDPGMFEAATSARWSADGKSVFVLGKVKDDSVKDDSTQVWRLTSARNGKSTTFEAQRVTALPLDVSGFKLSPDGKQIVLSVDVFHRLCRPGLHEKAARRTRQTRPAAGSTTSCSSATGIPGPTGARSQLFIADVPGHGSADRHRTAAADPRHRRRRAVQAVRRRQRVRVLAGRQDRVLRRAHRRQDRAVVDQLRCLFGAGRRLGAAEEPDRRESRPGMPTRCRRPTARRLYYLAMKRPASRPTASASWRSIWPAARRARSIRNGTARPARCSCRRTAETLYTTTDDEGDHALFAIDVGSGKVDKAGAPMATVDGFDRRRQPHRARAQRR